MNSLSRWKLKSSLCNWNAFLPTLPIHRRNIPSGLTLQRYAASWCYQAVRQQQNERAQRLHCWRWRRYGVFGFVRSRFASSGSTWSGDLWCIEKHEEIDCADNITASSTLLTTAEINKKPSHAYIERQKLCSASLVCRASSRTVYNVFLERREESPRSRHAFRLLNCDIVLCGDVVTVLPCSGRRRNRRPSLARTFDSGQESAKKLLATGESLSAFGCLQ
jgi:hypothetical protein